MFVHFEIHGDTSFFVLRYFVGSFISVLKFANVCSQLMRKQADDAKPAAAETEQKKEETATAQVPAPFDLPASIGPSRAKDECQTSPDPTAKLSGGRSRLYRLLRQREWAHFPRFVEIYKMCVPFHLWNLEGKKSWKNLRVDPFHCSKLRKLEEFTIFAFQI